MIDAILSFISIKDLALLSLGGLVSWWTSRFFYQKQVQRRELTYCIKHSYLLPEDVGKRADFSLTMSGRKLVNPLKIRVAIWNSGNHLIQRDDFGGASAIAVNFYESELLAIELVKISRNETSTSIAKEDSGEIAIALDYWNPDDGLIFDAYVDTNLDKSFLPYRDIKIIADIRGNEAPLYHVYWKFRNPSLSLRGKAIYGLALFLVLTAIAIQIVNLYQSDIHSVMIIPNVISTISFAIVLFAMILVPISDRQPKGRSFPSRLETKTEDQDLADRSD